MYHGIYEVADLIENKGETCKRSISKKLRPELRAWLEFFPKMGTGLTAVAVRPISLYFYFSWLSEMVGQRKRG